MESRYRDDALRGLDLVDQLVQVSRWVGAETSLAVWGGGNTSVKLTEPDLLDRPVRVLRVKGSGSDLKSVARRDFPGVRLPEVLALLERDDMGDQEMVDYLARCLQEPGSPRPSIETLLHGFLDAEAVIHTHADAIVGLTNTERGRDVVEDLFGKETVWVPYRRPGFRLSKEVWAAIRAQPAARAIVLEKHGLSTWGATLKEAYLATIDLVTRAEDRLREAAQGRRVFGAHVVAMPDVETRWRVAREIAPVLRGMLGREPACGAALRRRRRHPRARERARGPQLTQVGPSTPDHTIYSKRVPCFVPLADPASPGAVVDAMRAAVDRFMQEYTAYFEAHRQGELIQPGRSGRRGRRASASPASHRSIPPGRPPARTRDVHERERCATAGIVADIYHHTAWVLRAASALGPYSSLSAQDAFNVEFWPLELYKLQMAPPEKELARRVALVTGGASGIGRAVARRLAGKGRTSWSPSSTRVAPAAWPRRSRRTPGPPVRWAFASTSRRRPRSRPR